MKAYHIQLGSSVKEIAREIATGTGDFWLLGAFHLYELICAIAEISPIEHLAISTWLVDVDTASAFRFALEKGTIKAGDMYVGSINSSEGVEFANAVWGNMRIHRMDGHCKFMIAKMQDGRVLCSLGSSNTNAMRSTSCQMLSYSPDFYDSVKEVLEVMEESFVIDAPEQTELSFGGMFE